MPRRLSRWSEVGTAGFKAPEIYLGESDDGAHDGPGYSLPVDVFAFGCTVYELLTFGGRNRGWPFGCALDLCTPDEVERAVLARKPPSALGGSPVPADCPVELRQIYERCIAYSAASRPTFDALVSSLRDLLWRLREQTDTVASPRAPAAEQKPKPKRRKR